MVWTSTIFSVIGVTDILREDFIDSGRSHTFRSTRSPPYKRHDDRHDDGRSLLNSAPRFLFLAAVILLAFAIGWRAGAFEICPHAILSNAYKTAKTQIDWLTGKDFVIRNIRFVDVVPDRVEVHRFEFVAADALTDPIRVLGGLGQFAEYCPGHAGCLAVEYAGKGVVQHAYPYRPEEIEKTSPLVDLPYEQPLGFSMRDGVYPMSASRYANGDLLIVFQSFGSFPYGRGVARIDRDGWPIWYRRDYSHHEPYIAAGDVGMVPNMRIGRGPRVYYRTRTPQRAKLEVFQCKNSFLDLVHVIDGEGQLLKEISIIDALNESPYAPILRQTRPCDPTHLNSVHELNQSAGGGEGRTGDLVVSLRNLSAFGILDGDTYRLKRLVRGKFFSQHSVKHLKGSRFLMFDNWGREGTHGPSRLLMVDIANGAETTIFPNDRTPEHLRNLYSNYRGAISISPDRRRVFITFTKESKAIEVRISDGAVLTVFNFLHDIRRLDSLPGEAKTRAAALKLKTIHYIDSGEKSRHER